jgi:hypothetical protein
VILTIIVIIGVPLLIAVIVIAKHNKRKESRALDDAIFQKVEDLHE